MNTATLQDRRVWIGGGAVAALIIIIAAWFLFISPELSSASQLRSQAADTQTQNDSVAAKNATLAQQSRSLGGLKAKLVTALDSLPPDSGLPTFTHEVTAAATAESVGLTSITVGAVAPAGVSATAPAPAAAPETDSTSTASPATPATTPTGGQYSISVTLLSTGPLRHQIAFVKALQNGPRRVLVTSSQVSVAGSARVASVDATTTMTTQLTVFSAPMSADQVAQLKKMLATGN